MTFEGDEVLIPNRLLFENPLKNYYKTKTRRVDLEVGVSYAENLDRVEEITKKAIENLPNLADDTPVQVIYKEFGGSSINLQVRYWVPYLEYYQYLKGKSDGIKAIKNAYDKNDIAIPFPIRTLDFGIKGGKSLTKSLIDQAQVAESN
jgi:small-conductance mechanosensitive channel